jgi:hypothetical protein
MASYLTDAEKTALEGYMTNLHDTFKRELVIYKDGEEVVITTDPNYNFVYAGGGSSSISYTPVSQTFSGRILYGKPDSSTFSSPEIDAQLRLEMLNSTVRLKVDRECKDFLAEAKRVEFDGNRFKIVGDIRPHGLFTPNFYTFYLIPIDEQ